VTVPGFTILFFTLSALTTLGQRPEPTPARESSRPSGGGGATVALTSSMEVLNDSTKLSTGDRVSFRIVEERRDPIVLTVSDSGEMEVPLVGRVTAAGKTCKQLAYELKPLFERDYFYRATVIVGLETFSNRSRGKVYLMGQVRGQGAMDIPADEALTVSKAILRAGGLSDFANRRRVKLVRKRQDDPSKTDTTIVNLVDVLDKGRVDKDPALEPDDLIIVPEKLINF
jgi:polysaccharide export outer membrane protein